MEEMKKRPGRPPRSEQIKSERRRRKSSGFESQQRMVVPQEWKDHWKEYELRWINDTSGRIHQKTQNDDWDICYQHEVPGAIPVGEGERGTAIVTHAAGLGGDGRPYNAILCRKPKKYFEEDKAERQRAIKEQEDAILDYKQSAGDGLNPQDGTVYVPSKP